MKGAQCSGPVKSWVPSTWFLWKKIPSCPRTIVKHHGPTECWYSTTLSSDHKAAVMSRGHKTISYMYITLSWLYSFLTCSLSVTSLQWFSEWVSLRWSLHPKRIIIIIYYNYNYYKYTNKNARLQNFSLFTQKNNNTQHSR